MPVWLWASTKNHGHVFCLWLKCTFENVGWKQNVATNLVDISFVAEHINRLKGILVSSIKQFHILNEILQKHRDTFIKFNQGAVGIFF